MYLRNCFSKQLFVDTSASLPSFSVRKFNPRQSPVILFGLSYPADDLNQRGSFVATRMSILQDKSGQIWFGTTDGGYCFNGKSFTRFLDNERIINKSGLHLRSVQCIAEDKNGNIWFGSGLGEREGACRYDGKSITGFKPNDDDWVRSILQDKNGNLWFACRHKGLCRYDGKTFTDFTEKEEFGKVGTGSIIEDIAGNIWFASLGSDDDGGLWSYNGKTFKNFTTKNGLSNNSVFCIVEGRAGNIWAGTRGIGLCRYDGKTFINYSE